MGVSRAALALEISTSAAHRLLQSLVGAGFVEQNESRAYQLAPGVLTIAQRFLASVDIRDRARPVLEQLRDLTGETACLIIRRGQSRVCVDYVLSQHEIAYLPQLGETLPITAGATGQAFLSALPEVERLALLTKLGDNNVETPAPMEVVLDAIEEGARRGYFQSMSDRIRGMNGVAFPLVNSQGRLVATMSVVGPADRWTRERMADVCPNAVQLVRQYAQFEENLRHG